MDTGRFSNLDAPTVLETIRSLNFIRVCGSDGERRGFDVVTRLLDDIGVRWQYHVFGDNWLEPDDPHLLVRGRKLIVRPALQLPFYFGVRSGDYSECRADVSGDLAPVNGCAGKIAVVESFARDHPVCRGASAQLIAFPFEPEMEPYYWAATAGGPLPPIAIVSPDDISFVLGEIGETATLRWSERIEERVFRNLVAEVPGAVLPDEIVVMGAHMDTWPGTVGSSDDAAGSAVLVEAARWFSANPAARTVRLVWFTGEETCVAGSRFYVRDCVSSSSAIKLMVNVDSGCELGTGGFLFYASDEATVAWARARLDLADLESHVLRNMLLDAGPFVSAGIPAFGVEAPAKQSAHLPTDDPEHIDLGKLEFLLKMSVGAAALAANGI